VDEALAGRLRRAGAGVNSANGQADAVASQEGRTDRLVDLP
jgi:hypothetical protein